MNVGNIKKLGAHTLRGTLTKSPEKSQPSPGSNFFTYNFPHYTTLMRNFPYCPSILLMAKHLIYMRHNFRQVGFFTKITSAFLKTGINLRNLPPTHSHGDATFSGLCPYNQKRDTLHFVKEHLHKKWGKWRQQVPLVPSFLR